MIRAFGLVVAFCPVKLKLRFFVSLSIVCFATSSAIALECGQSKLNPVQYAAVDSHLDLRQAILEDLRKYQTAKNAISMLCFARHYSELSNNQPFGTNAVIRYGNESSHDQLFYFDILVWEAKPGTKQQTSVAYWLKLVPINDTLAIVDDEGQVKEVLFEKIKPDPKTCPPSHFELRHFKNVRGKEEIERLIEQAIRANIKTYGVVDWLCLAEAFMKMGEQLSEQLSVKLIPQGPNQLGVYRFTIKNLTLLDFLFPAPGGSNGEFTAIVRTENPKRIAIVERGGKYRWLDFD